MIGKIATFFKNFSDWLKSDVCLLRYFIDAIKITNNNFILATPLIIFNILISGYLIQVSANKTIIMAIFFAMSATFFSGWLYSVKEVIINIDKNEKKDNVGIFDSIKLFPTGVGLHFIDFFLLIVIFIILFTVVIGLTYKVGLLLIGPIGIKHFDLLNAISSTTAMKTLLGSLTVEQQLKLSYWNMLFFFTSALYIFLMSLWAPEIIYNKASVLKALINSIHNIFKRFFKSLSIFAFLMLIYLVIAIFTAFAKTQILQFICTIIYFYYLVYAAVLIFLFYKKEFDCDE